MYSDRKNNPIDIWCVVHYCMKIIVVKYREHQYFEMLAKFRVVKRI